MSITSRMLTLIAVTLLLVAAGELLNGLNLRQKRLEELRRDTVQLARITELDLVRILDGTHQLLATLSVLPAESGWDARACSVIQAAAGSDFEYDHIVAVDRLGNVQCGGGAGGVATKLTDRDLLARIVETGRFSLGSYGTGQISGNGVLRAGYPVNDAGGSVIGAVYAGISVTWLNNVIGQWQLGEEAAIDITDRNGIVVARHPDPTGIGRPIEAALEPFVSQAATGFTEAKGPGGVARLYGYVPVNAGQSGAFAVFVGRDRDKAFAAVNRAVRRSVGLVLIGLTLAALVALYYVRRFLERDDFRPAHSGPL